MGPQLFRPRQPLADYIDYFGYWDHRRGSAHQSRALPRGAATIVIDVGDRSEVFAPHPDVTAVLAVAEHNPSMRVADAVALTGLSPRRLINLFRAQVGLTPKSYLRVRRLQAALRHLDNGPARGAHLAAALGYFDQAHFVREFRAFTETSPTQYLRRRSWLPGHLDVVEGVSTPLW
jgi:AraC-like DNA-binding protein